MMQHISNGCYLGARPDSAAMARFGTCDAAKKRASAVTAHAPFLAQYMWQWEFKSYTSMRVSRGSRAPTIIKRQILHTCAPAFVKTEYASFRGYTQQPR